ncbi:hypothetical protein [Salimicrobium halophilum]|nr:hypothetical protein [Salimicrobium halophilum]
MKKITYFFLTALVTASIILPPGGVTPFNDDYPDAHSEKVEDTFV